MTSFTSLADLPVEKVKRILVYPNITSKNYETDSYVDALSMMISSLREVRSDLFWHIISPAKLNRLDFPNTQQFVINGFNTYSPQMRIHFNTDEFAKEVLNYKTYQYDVVFSHLPEHTLQLMNLLKYRTHFELRCFGYCHWFDFPKIVTWKDTFMHNITGLLEMDKCFVNTQAQKDLVLKTASDLYSPVVVQKLNSILEPNYLGIKETDCAPRVCEKTEKIIAFNHRPWVYKDYDTFLKTCDLLWQKRQDFKVWVPLEKTPQGPYMYTDKFDKKGYYEHLSKCRVCYAPKQKYAGWSISATDAMMNGCPAVYFDAPYYKELCPVADTFSNPEAAVELLSKYLDDEEYRNTKATEQLQYAQRSLPYKNRSVHTLSAAIDDTLGKSVCVQSQSKLNELKDFIKKKGVVSKKDLLSNFGWGQGINFTRYRSALLKDPNIYDFQNCAEPHFVWKS